MPGSLLLPSRRSSRRSAGGDVDAGFAPHVETASGVLLPDDYMRRIADAVHEVGGLFVLGAVFGTRSMRPRMRARALAASVAIVYATTAGLMKSTTQISHLFGLDAVLTSWQLWVLIALVVVAAIISAL